MSAVVTTWVLCVMLDTHSPNSRICQQEPDQATCVRDLSEWVSRSYAWEVRSGIHATAVALCGPDSLRLLGMQNNRQGD